MDLICSTEEDLLKKQEKQNLLINYSATNVSKL